MAFFIYKDLIKDAIVEEQWNAAAQLTYARYDRSFFVGGITGFNADTILDQAVIYVKGLVPVNTQHPRNSNALARYYRAQPVQSDTAAEVIVTFLFQFGGIPTEYTIELDSGLEAQDTNVEWDDNELKHILVPFKKTWMNANQAEPSETAINYPAHVTVLKPIAHLTYSKTIDQTKRDTLLLQRMNYLGRVNSDLFQGADEGQVLCTQISAISLPYAGQFIAKLGFAQKEEGWQPWARISHTEVGPCPNAWRDPQTNKKNGYKQAAVYRTAPMNALVALI